MNPNLAAFLFIVALFLASALIGISVRKAPELIKMVVFLAISGFWLWVFFGPIK